MERNEKPYLMISINKDEPVKTRVPKAFWDAQGGFERLEAIHEKGLAILAKEHDKRKKKCVIKIEIYCADDGVPRKHHLGMSFKYSYTKDRQGCTWIKIESLFPYMSPI